MAQLKNGVLFLNAILLAIGVVVTSLATWTLVDKDDILEFTKISDDGIYDDFRSPGMLEVAAVIAVVEGSLLVLLSVVACCAAFREAKQPLTLYTVAVSFHLLALSSIIALAALQREIVNDKLEGALKDGIRNQYEGYMASRYYFSRALDKAQVQFECCGVASHQEFLNTSLHWADRTSLKVPKSCCKLDRNLYLSNDEYVFDFGNDCAISPNSTNSNKDTPCYDAIHDWIIEKIFILIGAAVIIAPLEFLSVVVACCLLRNLPNKLPA